MEEQTTTTAATTAAATTATTNRAVSGDGMGTAHKDQTRARAHARSGDQVHAGVRRGAQL